MPKYRRKIIDIEAEPVTLLLECAKNDWQRLPQWVRNNYENGTIFFGNQSITIKTQKGTAQGTLDDMLCHGIHGELYTIKCDMFGKQYDLIN
jgi:hypothetical protein